MEAKTIRELYIQRVREHDRKIVDKEIKKIRQKIEEETRLRQEETRLRQEETRLRQEAENSLKTAILSCYNQGFSVEKVAEIFSHPLEFVRQIINQSKDI
jgi:hypothetical protein